MDIDKTTHYGVFKRDLLLFLKLGKEVAKTKTPLGTRIKVFEATEILTNEKINFFIWETEKNFEKLKEGQKILAKDLFFNPNKRKVSTTLSSKLILVRKISDLSTEHEYGNYVLFSIKNIFPPKRVPEESPKWTVHSIQIHDGEAYGNLVLWDSQIDLINKNKTYLLSNGRIKEFNGLQLHLTQKSELIALGKNVLISEEATA